MADNVFRDFLRDQMFMDNNPQAKAEADALLNFTNAYVEERKDRVLDSKATTILNVGKKHQQAVTAKMDTAVQEALLNLIRKDKP